MALGERLVAAATAVTCHFDWCVRDADGPLLRYRARVALSDRDRRLAWAVPVLMVAVAVGQMGLARMADLSPWKGAGFGMFSTVDGVDARFVRVTGTREDEVIPLRLPPSLEQRESQLRTLPSASGLGALADRVAAGTWERISLGDAMRRYQKQRDEESLEPRDTRALEELRRAASQGSRPVGASLLLTRMLEDAETAMPPGEVLVLEAVEAAIWRFRFDPAGPALRAEPLQVLRRPLRPGGS